MIVYRLVRKGQSSLDGKGAALYPGRWNEENIPCVYTSSSPSLAQLEVIVNIDDWKIFITVQHLLLQIDVPEKEVKPVQESELSSGWDAAVYPTVTQTFGTKLLNDLDLLCFSVPSAVSKLERNIILNPRAKKFSQIKIIKTNHFKFDPRLIR